MKFRYSSRRRKRREQEAFIARSFARLPEDIEALIRSLPVEVVFKAYENRRDKCIYYQQVIYLPARFWKDQWRLARWMKREHEAYFLHECFHAVDLDYLTTEERDVLLLPLTGYPTNDHKVYSTGPFPLHVDNGEQLAQWFHDDFAQSAAELFADTGVEAFTDHRFTRAATALQVTPEGKAAVVEVLTHDL